MTCTSHGKGSVFVFDMQLLPLTSQATQQQHVDGKITPRTPPLLCNHEAKWFAREMGTFIYSICVIFTPQPAAVFGTTKLRCVVFRYRKGGRGLHAFADRLTMHVSPEGASGRGEEDGGGGVRQADLWPQILLHCRERELLMVVLAPTVL